MRTLYVDTNISQHFLASNKSCMIPDDAANRTPLERCQNRNHSCPSCQQHLVIFRSHFPALWCPKKTTGAVSLFIQSLSTHCCCYAMSLTETLFVSIDGTIEIINMIMDSLTAFIFKTATLVFPLFPVDAHVRTLDLSPCFLAIDLSQGHAINFWQEWKHTNC